MVRIKPQRAPALRDRQRLPWMVWLSGLSAGLQTERPPV